MTGSAPSSDSRHSLSAAAAPTSARFQSEAAIDVGRRFQGSDTDQPSFRRKGQPAVPAPREIEFGSFRLLPSQFLLLEGDKPVHVGSRALEILVALLERPGELLGKRELMERVWPNVFVEPANLTVHISALRRTLRDGRDGNRFIINVIGRGYRFVAPVVRHEVDQTGRSADDGLRLLGYPVAWIDQMVVSANQPTGSAPPVPTLLTHAEIK
jgi:DNA-binding winged helix-turn-helix (wHTH) protein